MKRHLSLIVLLALMLSIFGLSYAQTTVTIGTGTSSAFEPFGTLYGYHRSLGLYTADQIGTTGQIVSLGWNVATAGSDPIPYKIYMRPTTQTSLTAMLWDDFTQEAWVVKEGTYTFNTTGWHTITLDLPFGYAGDNLLIGVEANYGGGGGSSYPKFYYTSITDTHQYWRKDTTPPNANGTVNEYLPNLQMTFVTLPANPAFNYVPNAMAFGSTRANTPTAYRNAIVINTAGGTLSLPAASVTLIGTDAAMFGFDGTNLPFALTTGQTGTIPVRYQPTAAGAHTATLRISYGGTNYDVALSGNAISEFALLEGFEGTVFPPAGWSIYDGDGGYTWVRSTSTPHTGAAHASIYYNSTAHDDWLITPKLAPSATNHTFSFYGRNRSSSWPEQFNVLVSTTDNNITSFTAIASNVDTGLTDYMLHSYNLTPYIGQQIYVAIQAISAGQWELYIDDVSGPDVVQEAPGAPVLVSPADTATDVITTPTLTWSAGAGGVATSYNIYCDTNTTPTTLIGTSTGTSFTLTTPLSYSSTYYWTVTAENSSGTGPAATPFSFTTLADPTVLTYPFTEGFETGQTDATPVGGAWIQYRDDGKTRDWIANSSQTDRNRTPRNGSFNAFLQWSGDAWLMRPFSLQANQSYDVEVYARQDGTGADNASVGLYYGAAGTIADMTYTIKAQTGVIDGDYQRVFGSFTPATTGIYWIGIHGWINGTPYYLSIDDIKVQHTPTTPIFDYTPTAIAFGTVRGNVTTAYQNVSVSNTGGGTLNLPAANVSIIGTDAAMFSFDPVNLPFNLATGASGTVPVRYQPTAEGVHTATLRMVYDGVNYDVALSGSAVGLNALWESFEGESFPPPSWTVHNGGDANAWRRFTGIAHTGSWIAGIQASGTAHDDWLITPKLTPTATNYIFGFFGNSFWGYDEQFNILVSTTDNAIASFTNTIASNQSTGLGDFMLHSYDLSAYIGQQIYVAIQAISAFSGGYLLVDDVYGPDVVPEPVGIPELVSPINGTMTSLTPSFAWGVGAGGIPTGYKVYCDTNNPPTTEVADVMTTGFSFTTALQPETTYYWTVKAYNGAGLGTEATARSFTTAPAHVVFVGNNATHTTGYNYPCVYGGYYANAREQYIITAAELAAAGATAGDFTTIAFNVHDPLTCGNQPNFTISMGATTAAEFVDNNFLTGLTQVFTAASYAPTAGWNTHTLTTPFTWDGTSNLVVQTSYDMVSAQTHNARAYFTATTTYKAMYFRDDTTAWNTVTTGERSYNRPNMYFLSPLDALPAAPILTYPADGATGLYLEGFNLTWEPDLVNGGAPDSYTVLMSTDPDPINNNEYYWDNITTTSFNPVTDGGATLVYSQRYYWTVAAENTHGLGDATDPPFSFVVEPHPTVSTYPWTENFDSVPQGELPRHWTLITSHTGDDMRPWQAYENSVAGAHTEPKTAVIFWHTQYPKDEWMITRPCSMQAGQAYKISFAAKGPGWGGVTESLKLHWGTDPTVAAMTANAPLYDNPAMSYADWTMESVLFIAPATGLYYFGWHAYSQTDVWYVAVDTITIDLAPAVDLAALNLALDALGNVGTDLAPQVTVQNQGGQAQSNYTVYIKEAVTNNVIVQQTIVDAINPGETVVHTLNWTPTSEGAVTVYAEVVAAGDADNTNNVTTEKTTTIYSATTEFMHIGDTVAPLAANILPFNTYWKGFVAETVYLASEIQATSGTIQQIVYYNDFRNQAWSMDAKVYMKNTDLADMSAGWPAIGDYTLVFDGTLDFPLGVNAIAIQLSTPFAYTGGNLAIRTTKDYQTTCTDYDNYWIVTNDTNYPSRTRTYQSDTSGAVDHANPATGSTYNYVPNITFIMEPATPVTSVPTPVPTVTTGASGPVLSWPAVPYAYSYKIYATADPYDFSAAVVTVVYNNSVEIDATTADKLFYKVTANTYRDYNGRGRSMWKSLLEADITDEDVNPIEKAMKNSSVRKLKLRFEP